MTAIQLAIGDFLLRPLLPSDRNVLRRYFCDPEAPNPGGFVPQQTPAQIDNWINSVLGRRPVWAFAIATRDALIGQLTLDPESGAYRGTAELGYWVAAAHQGQGVATAAVQAAVAYSFSELKLVRLVAHTTVHNAASIRVLEKAGFEREGCLRRSLVEGGSYHDQYIYTRINATREAPEEPCSTTAPGPAGETSFHRVAFGEISILAPEEPRDAPEPPADRLEMYSDHLGILDDNRSR